MKGLKLDFALLDLPMSNLSGGEKVRMGLAKALAQNPDILLLDEPTNHLDDEMMAWLENMLKERIGATVVASHHRGFLNRVCHSLVELNSKALSTYAGNMTFTYQLSKSNLSNKPSCMKSSKRNGSY